MNIRRAQVDDAPKLAQVHVDSWQVAYRSLVPDSFRQEFTYQSCRTRVTPVRDERNRAHSPDNMDSLPHKVVPCRP